MPTVDLLTIGSVLRDVTVYTTAGRVWRTPGDLTAQRILGFEYGAKIAVDSLSASCGGGAANVAANAAALGLRVVVLARLGNDAEGAHLRARLTHYGVGVGALQTDARWPTGSSFLVCAGQGD